MTIFDDLGKTLNDVAAATADMLGDLAEAAKVKTTIVSEKHELEALFAELGKTVYEARKENLAENSDDPSEEKIAELEAREEEMKAKEEAKEETKEENGEAAKDTDEEAVSDAEIIEEEETKDKDDSKEE